MIIANSDNNAYFGENKSSSYQSGIPGLTWKQYLQELSRRVNALMAEKGIGWTDDIPTDGKHYNMNTKKKYKKGDDGILRPLPEIPGDELLTKGSNQSVTPAFRTSGKLSVNNTDVFKNGRIILNENPPGNNDGILATKKYVDDKFDGLLQSLTDAFDYMDARYSTFPDDAAMTGHGILLERDNWWGILST